MDDLDRAIARASHPTLTRRRFLAGSGLALSAATLAACGPSGGASTAPSSAPGTPASAAPSIATLEPPATAVNLEFWNPFTGPDGEFMVKLVDQFNAEGSTVKVKVTRQADYYTKVRAAATAKRLPHVLVMHLDAIPQNAADGILSPIDDLVSLLKLQGSDFTQDVWDNGEYKGARYGVPLDVHTVTFYWNKDLFSKAGLDPEMPPSDKQTFEDAAKALTGGGVHGFYQVSTNNFLAGILWATWFYQGGGKWTNDDFSQVTYNSDAGVAASEFMASLVNDLAVSPKNVAGDAEIAAFKAGRNAMVMSGIWETTGYAGALGDKLGAGPVPKIFGDGVWAGSHNLAVSNRENATEDERQAAYYFIDWISKNSLEWAKAGQLPARASVREEADFKAIPHISTIVQQVDDARFFPPIVAPAPMLFDAGGAGEAALLTITGKKDAKTALDESAARYQKILEENKKKYGF